MASSSETAAQKKIILVSSDGKTYEIDEAAAEHSQTLKNMIEDECADNPIPLPNVTSDILAKVIEYCKQHTQQSSDVELLKQFDTEFVQVDQHTLFNTLLAANYLNISSLMDLLCQTVADMMKNKTPEEIRKTFHIVNDYTQEEEEDVRRENAWAFE